MVEVIRNYATIDGQVYHAEMVAEAFKSAGYIHISELHSIIDKTIKDANMTKNERIKILFDWIEALELVGEKHGRKKLW